MNVLSYKASEHERQILEEYGLTVKNIHDPDLLEDLTGAFALIIIFDDHELTMRRMLTISHGTNAYILFFSDDYMRLYQLIYLVSGAYVRLLTSSLLALYLKDFYLGRYLPKDICVSGDISIHLTSYEIYYIQLYYRTYSIYTPSRKLKISRFRFRSQMQQLEGFSFSNAGNSTFVNLHYVTGVQYSRVLTTFGKSFPLTRRYQNSFMHDYERYVQIRQRMLKKMEKKLGCEL